jgi:hypothetical protein
VRSEEDEASPVVSGEPRLDRRLGHRSRYALREPPLPEQTQWQSRS